MNEEAINVNLYGSGSRDCRLRAEYIFCDRANECSACAGNERHDSCIRRHSHE